MWYLNRMRLWTLGAAVISLSFPTRADARELEKPAKLSEYVLVWADASFLLAPDNKAAKLKLGSFPDGRAHRLGEVIPMKVLGLSGELVQVAPLSEVVRPDGSRRRQTHCGWLYLREHFVEFTSLFVHQRDLAPVVTSKIEHVHADGTGLALEPGTPVNTAGERWTALASFLEVPLPEGAPVGWSYASPPARFDDRAGSDTFAITSLEKLEVGGVVSSARYRPPLRPVAYDLAERSDGTNLVSFEWHCGHVRVSAPAGELVALGHRSPKLAADFSGGVGLGMGSLGTFGTNPIIIPAGTALRTAGRVVGRAASNITVPSADKPCVRVSPFITSDEVGPPRPEQPSERPELELCAAKNALSRTSAPGGRFR